MACFGQSEVGKSNTGESLSSVVNTAGNVTTAIREARWLLSTSLPISSQHYFDNV